MDVPTSPQLLSPLIEIQTYPWRQFPAIVESWASLHQRSAASFFMSALWVDVWLNTYGPTLNPSLLLFVEKGEYVAACVLVKRKTWNRAMPIRRVYLNCAGEDEADGTCIEYNRLLCLPEHEPAVVAALEGRLLDSNWDELALNGMDAIPPIMSGYRSRRLVRPSRFVNLTDLRQRALSYDSTLSPNTRQQIRRSIRHYEEVHGPIVLEVANDLAQARAFLQELAELHQKSWVDRGKPGVFASSLFRAFHERLLEDGFEAGKVQLLRISAGGSAIGLLHCFCDAGRIYFYQSGFAYTDEKHLKPGLVTHYYAVGHYLSQRPDVAEYDFMAGEAQYKRSLAKDTRELTWLVSARPTWRMFTLRLFRSLRARARLLRRTRSPRGASDRTPASNSGAAPAERHPTGAV